MTEKLAFLAKSMSINSIEWQVLQPDEKHTWLTEGMRSEFASFLPLGTKEAKSAHGLAFEGIETRSIFKLYSPGIQTSRDSWMYDFNTSQLAAKARKMIEAYNAELSRWIRAGCPKDIDSFVLTDETKIKWSSRLKECLIRKIAAEFTDTNIRQALYRPFAHRFVYFDSIMTHRQCLFPSIFPNSKSEAENIVICLTNLGSEKPFMVLPSHMIADMHLVGAGAGTHCFSYYTYAEDGSNQRENITDWALAQFQVKYGTDVTKWNIFHYVYAMLHHPQYRERYAENLKRDLPHLPLLHRIEAFQNSVRIGRQLMDLHLHYEEAKEYHLTWIENEDVPFSWRVEKMRLISDHSAVIVNESLTLTEIPQECFLYRLGNRSALDWVIDQYQVSEDKRSGIVKDPNNLDDEEYIVRLVGKVITVSVETVRLVNELEQAVKMEDWMSEMIEVSQ